MALILSTTSSPSPGFLSPVSCTGRSPWTGKLRASFKMYPNQTDVKFQRRVGLCFHHSITISGKAVGCIGGCQAMVDTGTSLIIGPTWSVRQIIFGVGARGVEGDVSSKKETMSYDEIPQIHSHQNYITFSLSIFSQFVVSCDLDLMPNVTFHIQGQEFPLPPSAYTIQVRISFPLQGFVSNLLTKCFEPRSYPTVSILRLPPWLCSNV